MPIPEPKPATISVNTRRNAARHGLAVFLLALSLFALYYRSLSAPFLFDDQINITDNPYIRITGLSITELRRAALQDGFQLRPLSNLTFGLDFYIHRLNPKWMHLANIILHLSASILLYFLVFTFLSRFVEPLSPSRKIFLALLSSLAWAAHPAHVQAVSYIVQRQTLLAAAGLLGTALFYLQARLRQTAPKEKKFFFAAAGLCFAAAALSKEIGWTAPFYLLLFELILAGRAGALPIKPKRIALLLILSAACLLLGITALVKTGVLAAYWESYEKLGYGPPARLLTESRVVVSYVLTMFFPADSRLALDQEVAVSRGLFHPLATLPAALVLSALAGGALISVRRCPLFAFMGLGFLIALGPESSLIPVELKYDHRIYFYSLFVLPPAAVAAGLKTGLKRSAVFLAAVVVFLVILTWCRQGVFLSAFGVWRDSARKSPGAVRPWSNLCAAYLEREDYRMALVACERADRLGPAEVIPLVNKAIALYRLGRRSEAFVAFARAVSKDPQSSLAHYNYGLMLEQAGRREGAIEEYGRAIAADQFNLKARMARVRLLFQTGRTEPAISELKLAARLFPDRTEVWLLLAVLSRQAGKPAQAEEAARAALQLDPSRQAAWLELARIALGRGDRTTARAALERARQTGPAGEELLGLEAELRSLGTASPP